MEKKIRMKYLRDFFNTPFKIHILIILGLSLITSYFYFLFILERPIREIPFTLNLWTFGSIILIILTQLMMLYRYFKPSSSKLLQIFIKEYLFWVLESLKLVDEGLKSLPFLKKYYEKAIMYFIRNVDTTNIYYWKLCVIAFTLLPRIILCMTFFFDVFYFHKLHYFYNVLWLGIFIYFLYYLEYCLKRLDNSLIAFLEENLTSIDTTYFFGVLPPEDDYWHPDYVKDDGDPDEEPPHGMRLTIRRFLEFRWYCIINNHKHKDESFSCNLTSKYRAEYKKKLNWNLKLNIKQIMQLYNSIEQKIHDVIKVNHILEALKKATKAVVIHENTSLISLSLLWLYFISWICIFIVSISSLSITNIGSALLEMSWIFEEPFSGCTLTWNNKRYIS